MTRVEGVVRQREGRPLEIVAVRPAGALDAMSRAIVERSAAAAQLEEGVWRLTLEGEDEGQAQVAVQRLADAQDAIAVARVARDASESVVVLELRFSRGEADPSVEERLSALVSEGVAAVAPELPAGEERWLEIVLSSGG